MNIQDFRNHPAQPIERELQEKVPTIFNVAAGIAIMTAFGEWEEGDRLKQLPLKGWRVIVLSGAVAVLVIPQVIKIGRRAIEEALRFFREGIEFGQEEIPLEEAEGIEDFESDEELNEMENPEMVEMLQNLKQSGAAAAA